MTAVLLFSKLTVVRQCCPKEFRGCWDRSNFFGQTALPADIDIRIHLAFYHSYSLVHTTLSNHASPGIRQ